MSNLDGPFRNLFCEWGQGRGGINFLGLCQKLATWYISTHMQL